MSNDIEISMLKQQIANMEQSAGMARSATLNLLIDIQVMLQDGDVGQVMEMLEELIE